MCSGAANVNNLNFVWLNIEQVETVFTSSLFHPFHVKSYVKFYSDFQNMMFQVSLKVSLMFQVFFSNFQKMMFQVSLKQKFQ